MDPATQAQIDAARRLNGSIVVGLGPGGCGKAQPLTSCVLTPAGWKPIGEMRVGDKIIDPDGGTATVRGVFPQGEKDVYRVTFSDGAQAECCAEHLWLTQTEQDRAAKRPGVVRSLEEIMATPGRHGKRNHSIPSVDRIDIGTHELPLAPYLLGVLLGDGGMTARGVKIHNPESDLIEAARALLSSGMSLHRYGPLEWGVCRAEGEANEVVGALRELGLMGHRSTEKFIPTIYRMASYNDRLALLRGLMDTDGHVTGMSVEYTSSSPELAHDVQALVWSLGGKAVMNSRIPTYTYKGEKREGARSYRIHISMPGEVNPFMLKRKADAWVPRTKYQPTRFVDDVTPIGRAECVCISVDSKRNLYITDDFVVTHNTETLSRLSMACAFFNGINWYGYDSNGDLFIHLSRVSEAHAKGIREARTSEEESLQRRKLEFAEQCKSNLFRGPKTLEKLKASVGAMIASGLKDGKPKKPRAVLFIDEAGAVRDFDDEFWSAMRQARNAGLTLYSTGHRLVDYHPSARTNIRLLILWAPVDAKFYDINGVKIAREKCTPLRSERIHYFVGGDPTPLVWDRGRYPNHYPAALITPATPTQGRVLGF